MYPIDIKDQIDALRDSPEARYAAKHAVESGIMLQGWFQCDVVRQGRLISGGHREPTPNTFTTEGMNRMLDIILGDTSKTGSNIYYVHLFKNNVTPAVGNTAATAMGAAGTYGICQDADYDDPATNAPSYTPAAAASASCTNSASKAEFTIKASITLYGACLSTIQAKTGTSGILLCAKKFTSSRNVVDDDEIYVNYTVTMTTS